MAGGNDRCYGFGATQISVGISATAKIIPPPGALGGFFHIQGAGGSCAIVNGASQVASTGYLMSTTEVVQMEGPATFYIAASGVTTVIGIVWRLAQGYSTTLGMV